MDDTFPLILDRLAFLEGVRGCTLLVIREPKSDHRKTDDTWDETFDGGVAEARFHIETNVLVSFTQIVFFWVVTSIEDDDWWFAFFGYFCDLVDLIDDFGYWRVFDVHNICAGEVVLEGELNGFTKFFAFSRLGDS